MKIYIDADGCPVVNQTLRLAKEYRVEAVLLCDTSHVFHREGAKVITVSKGADSVDFALVNLVEPGDLVVTQDYGLAAMCLARRAAPLSQNIDSLLLARHTAKKIRSGGGRLKGPAKRTRQQDQDFEATLARLLEAAGNRKESPLC